jgi:SAM-dependent methyltransferase
MSQMQGTRSRRSYRYLLGDARREAARLRAQARLWDPVSLALFDRIDIKRGWRILEVGPGQGSLHLELRRRARRPVDAVELSPVFAAQLARRCRRDGFGPGTIWQTGLINAPLPAATYDLIFTRWVFLFLPNLKAHIRALVRALKPGGRLAIQDYHRETMALVPRPRDWEAFLEADRLFFASEGGDVSVGSWLPDLYRKAGLEIESLEVTIKSGHPGSPVWDWLSTYFLDIMPRYTAFPPFGPSEARRLVRHWRAAARHPTSILVGPALLDIVGRKRRA